MNFAGSLEGKEKNVELKYCERCGGLFLRPPDAGVVYCAGCQLRLGEEPNFEDVTYPGPRRKSRKVRLANGPKRDQQLRESGQIECLQGVATGVQTW